MAYNVTNRYMTKTYGNGDVTRNEYDVEWRPTSITTSNQSTQVQGWSYGYNAMGMITGIFASAETNLYGYDAIYQLTSDTSIDSSSTGITSWVYDEAGNRLSQTASAETNHYRYNADNELTWSSDGDAVTVTGSVQPGASSNKWYDTWATVTGLSAQVSQEDGTFAVPGVPVVQGTNTTTVTLEDVSGNTATQTVEFTKQNLSGSGFYGYDGNGNLTNEIVWTSGAAVTNGYSYDMENRLVKATSNGVTVLECWYDGVGRRIAKREILGGVTNAVQYVWEGWSILAVLDETGALVESYTRGVGVAYDIGSLVAVRHHSGTHSGSTYYLHHNHRGDVTAVRSGSTALATYSYAAYGEVADATGSYESRFGFSSKETDGTTGLLYFGFRYCAPENARWITRDPIGLRGGLNAYRFCGGNPISNVDPWGLLECTREELETALEDVKWGQQVVFESAKLGIRPQDTPTATGHTLQFNTPWNPGDDPVISAFEETLPETAVALYAHFTAQLANLVDEAVLEEPGNFYNYWGMVEVWRHQRLIDKIEEQLKRMRPAPPP